MQRVFVAMFVFMALCAGIMACDSKPPASQQKEVLMPDGSHYRINDAKTMKAMGVSEESLAAAEDKLIAIRQAYFVPVERMSVVMPLGEHDKLLAIDTVFRVEPQPADPDMLTIRDENGTYQTGILMGRVHLDMETGVAFSEVKGKEMDELPKHFRELLLYKVPLNFAGGLLYYQGKPYGSIHIADMPDRIPSLSKVAKPAPPAEKPIEVPESMKKRKDLRMQTQENVVKPTGETK